MLNSLTSPQNSATNPANLEWDVMHETAQQVVAVVGGGGCGDGGSLVGSLTSQQHATCVSQGRIYLDKLWEHRH